MHGFLDALLPKGVPYAAVLHRVEGLFEWLRTTAAGVTR